MVVDS